MATNSAQLQETILKAIDAVVTQRNNELKLDKTVTAIVKKNVGSKNGKAIYEVEYEGGRLTATAQNTTDVYIPNTSVYVLVPQGNFSNEKIIMGRASTISSDRSSSVVAAAANSYSIIGPNLIESTSEEKVKNIKYGLRSFHDHTTEGPDHPVDHRFQTLYDINSNTNLIKFNDNRLNIYKDQTTALMLKADFQTNLDIEQRRQSGARYGLIFNFSFDNLNKGFGETNGEIFENLAPIVSGKVIEYRDFGGQTQEIEVIDKALADYHTEITESDFSNFNLDMYIEYIQSLYNTFLINKKKLNTDLISNLITAYLNLLNNLKEIDLELRASEYENWWSQQVGDPGQKIEQFVLTSDMMLGNPLSFSQWNTQYSVFTIDMNTFNHVESIYFFKEGFVENQVAEQMWPIEEVGGGPDIFVKNIQIYAMKPLEAQSGDYTLKVEPLNDNDFILSTSNSQTQLKATVLRRLYEDLTYNDQTSYYWFKESPSVTNSSSDGYNYLAGVGWSLLPHNESKYLFSTKMEDNPAYKNNYKCVVVYEPATDNKTILATSFAIYNEDAAINMKLESDIGTEFSFDQGAPTIKVLVHNNEMQEDEYNEIGFKENTEYTINNITYSAKYPKYRYIWAITDSVNGQKIFLADSADNENFLLVSAKQNILNRINKFTSIGFYDTEKELVETEDSYYATRIKYPVYTTSTGFTVECYLQERKPTTGIDFKYYDVGSAQLEFTNQNENLVSSDFRIQIVNGDQVFQYDEYGNAPTVNKLKQPLEVQPLQAKLISRSGLEIEGSNYNVEWIFPIENTLITTDEILVENSSSQLIQSYYAKECNFNIKEIYNPNCYNNQITCHISFNDIDLYKDTNFYFGKVGNNGTNGTDIVAKIEYAQNDDVNLLRYEPLTLYVQKGLENKGRFNVRDATGALNNFQATKIIASSIGESVLKLALYQKNIALGESSYAAGYPKWSVAGSAVPGANDSVSLVNIGKFFETESSSEGGSSLQWNYDYNNENNFLRIQNLKAEAKLTTGETYYAYFSLPIIEYEEGQNLQLKLHKDTIAIDRPFYLNEIVYNADGRNPIYNHNAGLKLINLPEKAIVYWKARGGTDNKKRQYGTGIQEYYESTPDFKLSFEKDSIDSYSYLISEYTLTHEADMQAAYELERQKAIPQYYTEIKNENDEIIGYDKGVLYLAYEQKYSQERENTFSYFKKRMLRKIQDAVKRAWINTWENTAENGKTTTLKDGSVITQKEIEETYTKTEDFADSFWFSSHTSEWWDDSNWNEKLYKLGIPEEEYNILSDEEKEKAISKENYDTSLDEQKEKYDYIIMSKEEYDALSEEEKEKICYHMGSLLNPVDYFNSVFKTYEQFIQENKDVQTQIVTEDSAMVYVLPNDSYSGGATNNRIEASIYTLNADNERELYATVYAPINMTLNTFGLASVNAWDGNSIKIDEDRGAVLAPQIAAGEKDENNRFTGIVMGKTETYTGEAQNEKENGLFGYAYGLQSIFLDSETGNATFGLPDGNKIIKDRNGQYIGLGADDYNEGRIELRPGDVSKIGGWRLGRRSLYYVEGNRDIGPKYQNDFIPDANGNIVFGTKYNDHHERDIKEEDAGVLLHSGTYPYLSIKGKQLDLEKDGLNINDSLSYLMDGDSLEVQIDPYTPTLFTIFRHNGQPRYRTPGDTSEENILYPIGSRTYLAGINGRGQLVANGLQNVAPSSGGSGESTTSLGINKLPAFGETQDQASHVGFLVQASNKAVTKIFIKEEDDDGHNRMYISGSLSIDNEYARPISMLGKDNISLYVSSNNNTSDNTDANIQISTDSAQIELGSSTGLLLQRNHNANGGNYLHTAGPMTVNIGDTNTAVGKQALNVNAAATSIAINGAIINNAGNTSINNTGTTTVNSQSNISLNRINIVNNTSTTVSQLQLQQDNVLLGIPAGSDRKSLITMSHNGDNSWDTIGTLNISSTNTGNAILIHANHLGAGPAHNGLLNPQLELRAGQEDGNKDKRARITLSSSNNNWASTIGAPIVLGYGSELVQMVVENGNTTNPKWRWIVGMNENIKGGLKVEGPYLGQTSTFRSGLTDYNADIRIDISGKQTRKIGDNNVDYYGMIKSDSFWSTSDAHSIYFSGTSFSGSGTTPTYDSGGYYTTSSINNLKDAINNCLKAAGEAKARADEAYTKANNIDLSGYATTSALSNYVTMAKFNSHTHKITRGTALLNSTLVNAASAYVVTTLSNDTDVPNSN